MLKKAGAAAAIAAAGLLAFGSSAMANPSIDSDTDMAYGWDYDEYYEDFGESEVHDQLGLLNFSSGSGALDNLSFLCNDDVNVLAVPVLQGNDGPQMCGNSDDDED